MVALQQTLGILLLVYSAVALSQERKYLNKRQSDWNEKDSKLAADVSGNSEEYIPVKLGRTIYQSAWSTENAGSSEEKVQNDKALRAEDQEKNGWSLAKLLGLAFNFVKKLKGESVFPEIQRSKKDDLPRSEKINEDKYLNLFKKWLRKNNILKKDDSISSDLLEPDSDFNDNNHKSYRIRPRKKSFEKVKPTENKNIIFNEKNRNLKESESYRDHNNGKAQALKRNHQDTSASKVSDQNYKKLSSLNKANEYDSFSDENCDFIETLDKKEQKDSKNDKLVVDAENSSTDFKGSGSCGSTSTETVTSSSSESDEEIRTHEKHSISEPSGEIKSKPHTVSTPVTDSIDLHPEHLDENSHPPTQKEDSLKAVTSSNVKTYPNESGLNETSTKKPNEQLIRGTKSNKSQNILQNQNIPKQAPKFESDMDSFTEKSIEPTSENKQMKEHETKNAKSDIDYINHLSLNQSPPGSSSSTGIPEENTNYSRVSESGLPFTTPKSVSSSKPQGKKVTQGNGNSLQVTKKVVQINSSTPQTTDENIPKATSSTFSKAQSGSPTKTPLSDSATQNQDERSLKESSNVSQVTLSLSLVPIPVNNSPTKIPYKGTSNEKHSDSQNTESVPQITMPLNVSSSKNQDIRTPKENSKDSQENENVSKATIPVSSSSPWTAKGSLPKENSNDLPVTESISPATKPSKDSPSQLQKENTTGENLNNSQATDTFSLKIPVIDSSAKTTKIDTLKEKKNNLGENEIAPTTTKPLSVSSSESQDMQTPKENLEDSQMNENITKAVIPASSSSSQTTKESLPEKTSDNLPVTESIFQTAKSSKDSPSDFQEENKKGENSNDSKMIEKFSPTIPANNSSPKTANENNPKENQSNPRENESVPTVTISKSVSSSEIQDNRTLTENSQDVQMSQKALEPATPLIISSPQTEIKNIPKENLHDSQGIENGASATTPIVVSSSKPEDIQTQNENSKDSQMTHTISNPTVLVSSFSDRATDKTNLKETSTDLLWAKSVLQTTESFKSQSIETLKKNSDISPEATPVNILSPQSPYESDVKDTSTDLPLARSDPQTTMPLTDSPPQPQEEGTLKESSINSQMRDTTVLDPSRIFEHQLQAKHIPEKTSKNQSPQSNQSPILNKNFKPQEILTKPYEFSRNRVENQKHTNTENMERKGEFETNHMSKHEDSDIKFNGNYHSDEYTFAQPESTLFENKNSDIKNSHFEEWNSYTISDETDLQNNKQVQTTNHKSTALAVEGSTEQKSQFIENQSLISSFDEELSDNNKEDQANEDDEQQEKYDTFLQYIYKNSNNSYFQTLRNKSGRF